jgi:hypothetical protein
VVSINVGWTVDRFVEEVKEAKKRPSPNGKDMMNGKKPAKAKASANRRVKKSAPKKVVKPAKKTLSPKVKKKK